ncbi:hypothetical protein L873DRAFT_1805567 [Choiromyces venosus 120613-1]|uniref:Uncharacterized protein n=1 Tax=Choiromyces venosus 120613-1 TaxID=1336337 RepID=A0A3N4JPE0_9PEZI|nr:hypothetical protein L873DRAFT_1805567 [Choiromyces venosus 120613-1]
MEDPREIAWKSRLGYHSRTSAVRIAFKASYAQAIPTARREQYYKAKLPELTKWVAKKCALEQSGSNDEGDECLTLEAIEVEDQEQAVATGPEEHALGHEPVGLMVLSDDEKDTPAVKEKLPPTEKEASKAKPLTAPKAKEPVTNSTAPPKRNKRLRTEIERLLDVNWGGNSTAILESLNKNGSANPSSNFLSPQLTNGETDSGPAAKRTRSKRNSLQGSTKSSNLPQESTETLPAKATKPPARRSLPSSLQTPLSDKPHQLNPNVTLSESRNIPSVHLTKPPVPTTNNQQKPKLHRTSKSKPKSKPHTTSKNPVTQTYLPTDHTVIPFQINVIFNRYPALYRLPRRQKRLDSPKLDIRSLIYRCRKAARNALAVAGKKGKGESEEKGESRENKVIGGDKIVFLRRNVAKGKCVWSGK